MPRPLAANSNLAKMVYACAWTGAALKAAGKMDFKRTDEDRKKFDELAGTITTLLSELTALQKVQNDLVFGADLAAQVTVVLGDEVQDRAVRDGNRLTKAQLAGKAGLSAEHAFGNRVDDLVRTELALQPDAVMRAAERLKDLPPYDGKDAIAAELKKAAGQQAAALDERTAVDLKADGLKSKGSALVAKCSEALGKVEAELLARFPRQYTYVGRFFADFSKPSKAAATDEPEKKE